MNQPKPEQVLAAALSDVRVRLALDPESYVNTVNAMRELARELSELRDYRSKSASGIPADKPSE